MRVIVGSALCLLSYFSKPNLYEPIYIWKNNRAPYQSGQREIAYPAKLITISVIISGQSTEDTNPSMECETTQCGMSACIRIYSNVDDYEAVNKTRVDIKYEGEKMAAASISTSSRYQIPRLTRTGFADIVCSSCHVLCSDLFTLFMHGLFTERFHVFVHG